MKNHQYAITIERLPTEPGSQTSNVQSLSFPINAHDDILGLVERMRQRGDFDAATAAAFTVGLKLLGGVMLKHRTHPLFEELGPQFGQFMKRLKGNQGRPDEAAAAA